MKKYLTDLRIAIPVTILGLAGFIVALTIYGIYSSIPAVPFTVAVVGVTMIIQATGFSKKVPPVIPFITSFIAFALTLRDDQSTGCIPMLFGIIAGTIFMVVAYKDQKKAEQLEQEKMAQKAKLSNE